MTTYPIPDTDIDLWRLCVDYEVDVITVFVSTKVKKYFLWKMLLREKETNNITKENVR